MILKLENLSKESLFSFSQLGCIVDTNVIFAASFPLDFYNEWADSVFGKLRAEGIPAFTNINIRSEFIELNRRVLIPEGLMDFYSQNRAFLRPEIEHKLKSLKTLKDRAAKEERAFKLSDSEIKKFRHLLSSVKMHNSNAWNVFCQDHFYPYIRSVWDEAIRDLDVRFLGTRAIESGDYFSNDLKWEDMMNIVGHSGIAASDAMIVNLFLKSKLPLIITADSDVRDTVVAMMPPNKFVLSP